MTRITDPSFIYTPSYETDLRKKFRAIIELQRKTELQRDRKIHSPRSTIDAPPATASRDVRGGPV